MRKIIVVILLCCSILWVGCESESPKGRFVSHLPVQVDEDEDYWGFIDRKGNVILEGEFDEMPSPIMENFFSVDEDNGYNVYRLNDKNKYRIVSDLEDLAAVGYMSGGLMPICKKGEHISVVDAEGNLRFILDEIDGVEVVSCYSFTEGLMLVELANGKYLYVNTAGIPISNKRYSEASPFMHGYALIEDEDCETFINTQEEIVCKLKEDEECEFVDFRLNKMVISRNDRLYLYTLTGEEICRLPSKVDEVCGLTEEGYIYENDDSDVGVISYDGNQLIRPKYESMICLGDYFLAKHDDVDNEIRLTDINDNQIKTLVGEEFTDLYYSQFIDFPVMIETDDDEMYMVDVKGNALSKKSIYQIAYDMFEDNYGEVKSDYVPVDSIVNEIFTMCGEGEGLPPTEFGAFFIKDGDTHCRPKDVSFIRNGNSSDFVNKKFAKLSLLAGNYGSVFVELFFDEVIADKEGLRSTPWLDQIVITAIISRKYGTEIVKDKLESLLKENGCELVHSRKMLDKSFSLYKGNKDNHLLLLRVYNNKLNLNIINIKGNIVKQWSSWIDEQN